MQRRDFISSILGLWAIISSGILGRKIFAVKSTSSVTNKLEVPAADHVYQMPDDPEDGHMFKLTFENLSQQNRVLLSCAAGQTFFNRTMDIDVDVNGTYLFIYSKEFKMWVIEQWLPELQEPYILA